MQTKTYFASSVPAALDVARKELGEDAMLVTSKPASEAARPFGRLEVTFAYDRDPLLFGASVPAPVKPRTISSEMDEIRRQIGELRKSVAQPGGRTPEGRSVVAERLIDSGFSPEVAGEMAAAGSSDVPAALAQLLESRIHVAPFGVKGAGPKGAESNAGEARTLAFVGPPGRGKTTTLVKVALRYGLACRVPVKIYSAGSQGVGCEEQMARYAAVLGVPFQACESLESLTLALNGDMWKGLSLIDTPGISPSDSGEIGDFARFFQRHPEIEKHLVLRAEARSADLCHVIARFSSIQVSRLLFTGMDEVVSPGAMADALIRTELPAGLVGTGQRIPEDLEPFNAARLVRRLVGEDVSAAIAA
jgi:flagellar biosynthesis protein FlhF